MRLILLLAFVVPSLLHAQEDNLAASTGRRKPKTAKSPTKDAQFPGGNEAFAKYMQENIKFPDYYVEGKVMTILIIEKDGSIAKAQIMKGIEGCDFCSEEAKRVLEAMPKWIPARRYGRKIRSFYRLPVKFTTNFVKE